MCTEYRNLKDAQYLLANERNKEEMVFLSFVKIGLCI